MKNLLIILPVVLFATSCNRHMLPTVQNDIRDSIVETEKIIHTRDTLYTPGDSVEIYMAIPCPSAVINEYKTNGKTKVSVHLSNGILKVKCKSDSLLHIIDSLTILKNKERYTTKTITNTIKEKVIKHRVPKWCWYLLAFNVLAIGWKFRYSILSLFK